MAALVQGIQYGLSSEGRLNEENDLIFVKLTDSACRAIEEYQRNKSKTSECPTIQFLGNEGRILIPTDSPHGHARFNFGLSTNADIEGLQGSFECIKHAAARSSSIRSLGAMHCKMRIQAKEDIYEATRNRVAIIEENSKKNCTREIKPGGPGIGKKVKMGANRNSHIPPSKRDSSLTKPYSKPTSNNYAPPIPRNGIVQAGNFVTSSAHTKPQGNNHAQKPGNPDVMRRPIRERLIHLLALRPYKKPELFDRIIKDGVRDRDKTQITNVLKLVAFLRDNTYHLQRHVWNDVQEEWPFYTEQEKQVLKRRKPQNLTPPGSSDCGSSGSGQSPTSTHPGSPPSTITSGKRPGYFDGADGLVTKRQRVSHYRKPESKPEGRESPFRRTDRDASNMNPRSREYDNPAVRNSGYPVFQLSTGNGLSYDILARCAGGNEENDDKRVSMSTLERELAEDALRRSDSILGPSSGRGQGGHHDNRNSRWGDNVGNPSQANRGTEAPIEVAEIQAPVPVISEFPEYLTSYTTIRNAEQRTRYKADFNADYSEYRELHAVVERVSRKFAQLEARLLQEVKDSPGWKSVKNQIVKEYQENKQDRSHQEAKLRFQYLHEKLSHIKRRVLEYDSAAAY